MKLIGSSRFAAASSLLLAALSACQVSANFYNRNIAVHTQQASAIPSGPDAEDIKICLIDSGIAPNPNLPQLTGGTITGESFVGDLATWKDDPNGMGTAIAGVIMAHGRSEREKVKGIVQDASAAGIRLHVARALGIDRTSEGFLAEVVSALLACRDEGVRIISLAFNIEDINNVLAITIDEFHQENNILFVGAVGNWGNRSSWFPASLPAVMSVGATAQVRSTVQTATGVDTIYTEVKADFSNQHEQVEISAVGDRVRTTWPLNEPDSNGFAGLSMTEMASAAVTGAAALLWSYDSSCHAEQIRVILLKTALQMGSKDCDPDGAFGWGHLRLKDAVDLLQSPGGCANGNDPDNIYLDANGSFRGCPVTEMPSSVPSVSSSPTIKPTMAEPTFIEPTHSPSYTKKSHRSHHSHSHHSHSRHWHEWSVVPQCEEQLTAVTCCDIEECYWDSVFGRCTRFVIDDETCSLCLVGAIPNPSTPEDCCELELTEGCLWDVAKNRCTRDSVDDPTCTNMSEPPSSSPTSHPTRAPTPKPTKPPPTLKPTKFPTTRAPTTDSPTDAPVTKAPVVAGGSQCTDNKKFKVTVKGKGIECQKAPGKNVCKKNDEVSGLQVSDICCDWCA